MVWHTIKEVADTYEAFARIAGQVGPGVAMIRSGDGSAGTAFILALVLEVAPLGQWACV
jgi:hypothetical protein